MCVGGGVLLYILIIVLISTSDIINAHTPRKQHGTGLTPLFPHNIILLEAGCRTAALDLILFLL